MPNRFAHRLRPYLQPGLIQLRRLWMPFVAIQAVGLAVVLAYFYVPAVEHGFRRLTDFKARAGLPFAAVALAFACGIVPEIFKTLTGTARRFDRQRLTFTLHNLVLFAILGVCGDLMYRGLADVYGEGRRPAVIVAKLTTDLVLYSPLVALPLFAFAFTLRAHGYRPRPALRRLGVEWYLREVGPILPVNFAFWIPMATLMYTLPASMTFVFSAIASAASATLLTAIASRDAALDAAGIDPRSP